MIDAELKVWEYDNKFKVTIEIADSEVTDVTMMILSKLKEYKEELEKLYKEASNTGVTETITVNPMDDWKDVMDKLAEE